MSGLTLRPPIARLIHDLEASGALTPTALDLSSQPDLSLETCTALAAFFGQVNHSSRWWIGDLLEFVEMRHGEYVAHVADATGLAPQTIENIMSVCRRVPPSRRRLGVPFSLHAEVASLPPQEQSRWLQVAEDEKLTKTELRARLRPRELPARRQISCPRCGEQIDV